MGQTAKGIRYPEPTDRVADGAAAMRTLAEDVDARIPVSAHRVKGGYTSVSVDASGFFWCQHNLGVVPASVTFMHGATGGQPGTPYGTGDYDGTWFRGRLTGISAAVTINIVWTATY